MRTSGWGRARWADEQTGANSRRIGGQVDRQMGADWLSGRADEPTGERRGDGRTSRRVNWTKRWRTDSRRVKLLN